MLFIRRRHILALHFQTICFRIIFVAFDWLSCKQKLTPPILQFSTINTWTTCDNSYAPKVSVFLLKVSPVVWAVELSWNSPYRSNLYAGTVHISISLANLLLQQEFLGQWNFWDTTECSNNIYDNGTNQSSTMNILENCIKCNFVILGNSIILLLYMLYDIYSKDV